MMRALKDTLCGKLDLQYIYEGSQLPGDLADEQHFHSNKEAGAAFQACMHSSLHQIAKCLAMSMQYAVIQRSVGSISSSPSIPACCRSRTLLEVLQKGGICAQVPAWGIPPAH